MFCFLYTHSIACRYGDIGFATRSARAWPRSSLGPGATFRRADCWMVAASGKTAKPGAQSRVFAAAVRSPGLDRRSVLTLYGSSV